MSEWQKGTRHFVGCVGGSKIHVHDATKKGMGFFLFFISFFALFSLPTDLCYELTYASKRRWESQMGRYLPGYQTVWIRGRPIPDKVSYSRTRHREVRGEKQFCKH